ncbi:MAG: hypothetical protein HQL03_14255 [Nitrospirae bacterium]|nr:hypothetical protein [Nitrospirota bacterium]MBF0592495.1 hypothetical protein [Nitrospirota bacterium]
MKKDNSDDTDSDPKEHKHKPVKIKLPMFISEEIGLGDVIKGVTSTFGIKPCGGCEKRAEILNNLVTLTPWNRH